MGLAIDGLIILVYFAGIVWIGLYMGRRENTMHDFALGAPGEGYKARSIAYAQLVIGLIMGRMLVGYIFLRPYYQYKVYTVYDYLAVRFGNKSKNYISALFLVMRTLASGARVFIPTIVMVLAWQYLRSGGKGITFSTEGT